MFKDTKYELDLAKIHIETLARENSTLQNKLFYSELRVSQLENLFLSQGATKEQIDMMIKQTLGGQEVA